MKRVLSSRNRIVVTSVFVGLLFTASSFTFGPVEGTLLVDNSPQKKEQRVKVIVNKNGKETKIDTTFNLADEKSIQFKVDSILNKLDIKGIESVKSNVIIHRGGKVMKLDNKDGENLPGEEQFKILIQNSDSGISKHERRIVHIGGNGKIYSFGGSDGDVFLPPTSPHSAMIIHKQFGGDLFSFDPKDESIISYDKKDIGKGLEKITIIRKKRVEHQQIEVKTEISDDTKK